jgi:hypothetical protein
VEKSCLEADSGAGKLVNWSSCHGSHWVSNSFLAKSRIFFGFF